MHLPLVFQTRGALLWLALLAACGLGACAGSDDPNSDRADGSTGDSATLADSSLDGGQLPDSTLEDAATGDAEPEPEPEPEPQPCSLDGADLPEGESRTFYNSLEAFAPDTCATHVQERTCTAGTLTGDTQYRYTTCEDFNPPKKPNIVFIMLDDLDLTDVGAYGSPDVKTPNIDKLANEGIRFTQYHTNSAVCSPSRAAILTGHYPARFGMMHVVQTESQRGIPAGVTTSAEILRDAGYRTMHVGKWHLGEARAAYLPWNKGFDRSVYRTIEPSSGTSGYTRFRLRVDKKEPTLYNNTGEYLTNVLTDHAVQFIENREQFSKPFFLNLWYLAPHKPLDPPANFNNTYGYNLNTERGRLAAMVTHADRQIGRVIAALRKTGQDQNTLVIVTSDNAGSSETHSNIPSRDLTGYKGSLHEGGTRVPMIAHWPSGIDKAYWGKTNDSFLVGADFIYTFAQLANAQAPSRALRPGKSFARALLRNEKLAQTQDLFWEINNRANNPYQPPPSGSGYVWSAFAALDARGFKLVEAPGNPKLFDLKVDPNEKVDIADANKAIVTELQQKFSKQRRRYADVARMHREEDAAYDHCGGYKFNGKGSVELKNTTAYDFHDGEFTFAAQLQADNTRGNQTLAAKAGSWNLGLEGTELVLKVHGEAGERVIRGGTVSKGVPTHVAFTAVGFTQSGQSIRLYIDGKPVASQNSPAQNWVQSNNATIRLGNNMPGTAPFSGLMSRPRILTVAMHPRDVQGSVTTLKLPACDP